MAIYEYFCNRCVKEIEISKPMSDYDKVERCPFCEKEMAKKISTSNFKINGKSYKNGYQD